MKNPDDASNLAIPSNSAIARLLQGVCNTVVKAKIFLSIPISLIAIRSDKPRIINRIIQAIILNHMISMPNELNSDSIIVRNSPQKTIHWKYWKFDWLSMSYRRIEWLIAAFSDFHTFKCEFSHSSDTFRDLNIHRTNHWLDSNWKFKFA